MIKQKEKEKETLKTDVVEAKKPLQPTSAPKVQKSFLEIEEAEIKVDILKVDNWPEAYAMKWCAKKKMPNGRIGNWVAVDKTHPEFKGIRPVIDHTPGESTITNGDLILCCMRKETHSKLIDAKRAVADRSSRAAEDRLANDIDKINSHLGNRKGAIRFTKE